MCFHGAARHVQLTCDFFVVAALQQQAYNLPFPGSEPDLGILLHLAFPLFGAILDTAAAGGTLQLPQIGQFGHLTIRFTQQRGSAESLIQQSVVRYLLQPDCHFETKNCTGGF